MIDVEGCGISRPSCIVSYAEAYAWKQTQQLHTNCQPGLHRGLPGQLSRIRRDLFPAMWSGELKIARQQVPSPPVAALLVARLEKAAADQYKRTAPRRQLREMLEHEPENAPTAQHGSMQFLLERYGITAEQADRIATVVRHLAITKRRRLSGKQSVKISVN